MAKVRNHSVEGKRQLMKAAEEIPAPPLKLRSQGKVYWDAIVSTRPSFEWNKADLIRLARLCQRHDEVDRIDQQIEKEGLVLIDDRGRLVANPLVAIRDQLEKTTMSMERLLSLFTPMVGGKKQNVIDQAREVENMRDAMDDDLLA